MNDHTIKSLIQSNQDYIDEFKELEGVVTESIAKQRETAGVTIKTTHFTQKQDREKSKKLSAEDPEYLEADKLLNQSNIDLQYSKKELVTIQRQLVGAVGSEEKGRALIEEMASVKR